MGETIEKLRSTVDRVDEILCNGVYGYEPGIFIIDTLVAKDQDTVPEIPVIARDGRGCKLMLSEEGRQRWSDVVSMSADEIGVDSDDLYVATGLSLLELANVINYSVSKGDSVSRLRKVSKAFRADTSTQEVCSVLSEHTGIDLGRVVRGLDQDDFAKVSRIRYRIGVALKGFGVSADDRKRFAKINIEEAITSLKSYSLGASNYLSGAVPFEGLMGMTNGAEVAGQVLSVEFPYLQVASSMPMNASLLLNK